MKNRLLQKGFTLLEILVSVTMIALIMSMVYTSYFAISKSAQRCNTKLSSLAQKRELLANMTRQIRCSYAGEGKTNRDQDSSSPRQKKTKGTDTIDYFSTGTDAPEQKVLSFVTTNVSFSKRQGPAGLWSMAYRLDERQGVLYVNKKRFTAGSKHSGDKKIWLPVSENINCLKFEFFDGRKWLNDWDYKQKERLPGIVRIELGVEDKNNQKHVYATAVNVGGCNNRYEANYLKRIVKK